MKTWRVFVWSPGEKSVAIRRYDRVRAHSGWEAKQEGMRRAREEGLDAEEATAYQEVEKA